jgi:2-amino-4-hydroxy-6-hydroxymethyldihydropteridine diphosphokinase
MSSEVVISVGSNVNYGNVAKACGWLTTVLENAYCSRLYETPAVNGKGRPYVNAVISGYINSDLDQFNMILKEYEISAGRDDSCRKAGIVPIDIDIVVFKGEVIREWDYRQTFFKIGYSELAGSVVKS